MVTPQPFTDGVTGAAKLSGGGFEAVGTRKGDQFLMEPVAVSAHAIEFEIGAMHPQRMSDFAWDRSALSCGGPGCPSLRSAGRLAS